ncbi:MAG: ABC transporter substrate-binding protein [Desulfobacterota bacterium]|nr:ABC transporter substrate-binding protein [Thermodesulfobacteriota bacterium]MDW8002363.1 ABC transporter substrate-binding protein [Deltaproteobacteria bacterium]
MKKLILILTVVTLFLVSTSYAQVKIGAVINLTGPASSWGIYHAKGHQDYIRYVNEVKGGIGGKKVELTVMDHAYKIPEGLKHVKKFCEERVSMLATWDTGLGIQAKPIVQEYKIPTINYSTGQDILKPPIDYMYLPFGTYILDSYAILEYIKAIHKGKEPPKVGLLTYNNPYGKTIHEPSKEYAAKHGIKIVGIEEFPPATVDLTTQLLKLKEAGAEYIFMQILPAGIITALKAADHLNYNVPFFGTWTSTDPDFFKLGKGIIRDRLFMQFCGALPQDDTPGIRLYNELVRRYKSVAGFDTSYWEGVVIGMIMERALEKSYKMFGNFDPVNVNKALETFRNEDFGGLIPPVTYTKDNHEGSFVARIVQIHEDATYTPLTNFFTPGKGQMKVLRAPK